MPSLENLLKFLAIAFFPMNRAMDKWEFLSAIVNSPQTTKSWEYNHKEVTSSYTTLLSVCRSPHLNAKVQDATLFATTFLEQFMALSAEQQKIILEILSQTDQNF